MKLRYFAPVAAALMLSACTDNDFTELDLGNTPLALTASTEQLTLEETYHASDAVTFEWTSGTNHGTGNRISYTLELAQAGTGFNSSYTALENVTQTYTWKPSVETLNSILIDNLGATPGEVFDLEVRVTAMVADYPDYTQTATMTIPVTTYKPVTQTLYIVGSANPDGADASHAIEMERTDNGVFSWTGNLNAGDLKFIVNLGENLPSYNNNGEGGLVYRESDSQPDVMFNIPENHIYTITANILTMTVSISQSEGVKPAFSELFLVGSMTDWGFVAMTPDPLDPFIFKIAYFFGQGGEFKFGTANGSWENMYKATQANAPYTDQSMEFIKGFDPDNKWYLQDNEANQVYRIAVDIRTGAERMMMRPFTPYTEMYLVGDATPNGWSIDDATPMTVDPSDANIFTWTGKLNAGELKFTCDKQSDWNGAWFLAPEENAPATGQPQTAIYIDKSDSWFKDMYTTIAVGDVDRKWKITEAGNYTITLNQLLDQVTITKN